MHASLLRKPAATTDTAAKSMDSAQVSYTFVTNTTSARRFGFLNPFWQSTSATTLYLLQRRLALSSSSGRPGSPSGLAAVFIVRTEASSKRSCPLYRDGFSSGLHLAYAKCTTIKASSKNGTSQPMRRSGKGGTMCSTIQVWRMRQSLSVSSKT